MTGKKEVVAKKPVVKKKPQQMNEAEYQSFIEREIINVLKLRGLYSEIEDFAERYYSSCPSNLREHYSEFDYFKEFLEEQSEEHMKNLEKIVKQKYPKSLP